MQLFTGSWFHLKQLIMPLFCLAPRLPNPKEGLQGIPKLTLGESTSSPALGPVQLAEQCLQLFLQGLDGLSVCKLGGRAVVDWSWVLALPCWQPCPLALLQLFEKGLSLPIHLIH